MVVTACIGELGGTLDFHHGAVAHIDVVFHVGHGGDDIHAELAVQAFLHDFHVQKPKESGAETEAQGVGSFRFPAQGGIVQAEFFQSFAQILVVFGVDRVDARINHGQNILVTRERFCGWVCRVGQGVADFNVTDGFDVGKNIAHHTFGKFGPGVTVHAEGAHFGHHVFAAGFHHADFHARLDGAFYDTDVVDDPAITVIDGVKNQGLQGLSAVTLGGGNLVDDLVQDFAHVQARLCRNPGNLVRVVAQKVAYQLGDMVGLCSRQVHLVQHGNHRQVVFDSEIEVTEGLGLDSLTCVHHQDGAFAGCQGTAHLVGKVHVPRSVDHVQDVFLLIPFINHAYGVGLDGNAALPFQVHVVQQLVRHFVLGNGLGQFDKAVGQGGFSVVDMGDNAEISDVVVLRHREFLLKSAQI